MKNNNQLTDILGFQLTNIKGKSGRLYEGHIFPIDTPYCFKEANASVVLTISTRNGENDFTHHCILKIYSTENLNKTTLTLKEENPAATHFIILEYPKIGRILITDDIEITE